MRLKSYVPFITVPVGAVILLTFAADVARGRLDFPRDWFADSVKLLLAAWWLSSGLIRWNTPYVVADEVGLTVFGHAFSMRPSASFLWLEIAGAGGRSFWDFRIRLTDGRTVKIPINGMKGSELDSLLTLIAERAGKPPGGEEPPGQGS